MTVRRAGNSYLTSLLTESLLFPVRKRIIVRIVGCLISVIRICRNRMKIGWEPQCRTGCDLFCKERHHTRALLFIHSLWRFVFA